MTLAPERVRYEFDFHRHIFVFYCAKSVLYDDLTNFTPTNTPTSGVDFAGVLWNILAIILSTPMPH